MVFDYDLFVIGGGSGGVRAGRMAAETGARVALAEEYRMGGTCVIRGCVPKKLMVFASGYPDAMAEAKEYGWNVEAGAFDWTRFRPRLRAELDRLENVYRANLARSGAEIFDMRATVVDPHEVELADGRRATAKHILAAVGGRPFKPSGVPGIEHAITSNEVFLLEELPRRVLIVGGGYIACEFACIFDGMGVETSQYYRGAQILRGFDGEARGILAESMRARGVKLQVGVDVARIEKRADGLAVEAKDGSTAVFDQVVYATGRVPNTEGLGLEGAGVNLGGKGQIEVDSYGQTNIPSVYAVGDATDRVNLTPVAIREGAAFVETVFGGRPTPVDHSMIPSAVFTRPEYGCVGMTEEAAREKEAIEVYSAAFVPMRTAFAGGTERALFKLVVSRATRRVLGAHVVAEGAAEMIQFAGVAVRMGATKEDFDRTVAVHPTMSEEIVLMKTPARST